MPSGATGARAVAASQGAFTGQFDNHMNQQHLIGGKSNLHQFDLFQTALSNATGKVCKSAYTEDEQHIIDNLEEVVIKELDEPDDTLLAGRKHKSIFLGSPTSTNASRSAKPAICPTRPACAA